MYPDKHWFFLKEWGWFCCKWKKAYDCLNVGCNCCIYNFKVIAYQIVLHNCAQIISLNQMVWNSTLTMGKPKQLSWYKNRQIISRLIFRLNSHEKFQLKILLFLYKNCKANKIDILQSLSGIVVYLLLLVWYD